MKVLKVTLLGVAIAAGTAHFAAAHAHAFSGKAPGMKTGAHNGSHGAVSVPELNPEPAGAAAVLAIASAMLLRPRTRRGWMS